MTGTRDLEGRRLLVVNDEFFLAEDIVMGLQNKGAEVVGPVGTIDDALDLIDKEALDGAVLDSNFRRGMAYPVADALIERDVPFVFATDYDKAGIPPRYAEVKRCEKPVDAAKIAGALFG